ncbi:MAG: YHS domain-containing (seleno)protein [Pseudomonadota bacterium]
MLRPLVTAVSLTLATATAALAAGPELNASSTGLALQGYDPVAYFTEGEPTKGDWTITTIYKDAMYRFASEEHKAAFEADPEAYLPEYGGYCAFGAAMGFKFDGDPNYWRIVDGELYLNISQDIQERWASDIPGFIELADNNWTDIEGKEPSELQ